MARLCILKATQNVEIDLKMHERLGKSEEASNRITSRGFGGFSDNNQSNPGINCLVYLSSMCFFST